jgi:MFS family permease
LYNFTFFLDIAYLNDDFVTREFGRVGAAFGIGVVVGPMLGAFLTTEGGLPLCFFGAAAVVLLAIVVTLTFFLETTPLIAKAARDKEALMSNHGYQSGVLMSALPIDPVVPDKSSGSYRALLLQKLNPFVPIATLFSNSELRVRTFLLKIVDALSSSKVISLGAFLSIYALANIKWNSLYLDNLS